MVDMTAPAAIVIMIRAMCMEELALIPKITIMAIINTMKRATIIIITITTTMIKKKVTIITNTPMIITRKKATTISLPNPTVMPAKKQMTKYNQEIFHILGRF